VAILFLLLGMAAALVGLLVLLAGIPGGDTAVVFAGILFVIGTVFCVGSGIVEKLTRLEASIRETASTTPKQTPLV